MGLNKMENDFSKKLNQREIAPSPEAWDRLNAMLTVAEEKKPTRSYGWLYIAAGVLGFLFIGTIFLMRTEEVTDVKRNEIVLQNPAKQSPNVPTIDDRVYSVKNETVAVTEVKTENRANNTNQEVIAPKVISNPRNQNHIAENNSINQNQINNQINNSIISQKPEQQITTVKVDELLATAQSAEAVPKSSVKVNAASLLSQVDGELELSFREKAIKNFKTAKIALANRNLKE